MILILFFWMFAPIIFIGLVVAIGEWLDRHAWRRDENRLAASLSIEAAWNLPTRTPDHERGIA